MTKKHFLSPILLLLSLAGVYLKTLAPALTWANLGADGGDLMTAAATGGIAHPSGYPLYLLLARGFQLLPFGELALCTNLMSATFALLTVWLVYFILLKYLQQFLAEQDASIAALLGAVTFGLSPLFWSQALITEVYTLHLFLVALVIYEGTLFSQHKNRQGFLAGLAITNHLTAIFLLPAILILNFFGFSELLWGSYKLSPPSLRHSLQSQGNAWLSPEGGRDKFSPLRGKMSAGQRGASSQNIKEPFFDEKKRVWQNLGAQILYFFLGASLYLILPLRALKNPLVNWENPVTLENFWRLLSGSIYRVHYLQPTFDLLLAKLALGASLLLEQFGIIGLVLGCIGAVFFFQKSRFYFLLFWIAFASGTIFLVYQAPDAQIYLLPLFLAFSCWIGISLGFGLQILRRKNSFFGGLLVVVFAASLLWGVGQNWHKVDASQDTRATDFLAEVLSAAPPDALLFAEGDQAVFALWYAHYALGARPDLIVLANDLLHYGWYQASIRAAYPSLHLPVPFPWASSIISTNPERPSCQVRYAPPANLICTSP